MEKYFELKVIKEYFDIQLNRWTEINEILVVDYERAKILLNTKWLKIISIRRKICQKQ